MLLRPLIGSIQEFLRDAGSKMGSKSVPVLQSVKVRRELFKLHYGQELFDLNLKADAFEVFDFLLTVLHSWVRHSQAGNLFSECAKDDSFSKATQLAKLCKIGCH